jgi:DNA-binding CsgD family transcriptional regulator
MNTPSLAPLDAEAEQHDAHRHATGLSDSLWLIPPSKEKDPSQLERALGERIKELNCLYAITQLAERHAESMDRFLAAVVSVLPPSWQFSPITEARIIFQGETYETPQFRSTEWEQSTPIHMHGEIAGAVTVVYHEACPDAFEGPFLREERALLDAVAERIGMVAARIETEQKLQESNRQLTVEREALKESNLALRAVLSRIEDEKVEVYRNIQANVERILMPIIHALMLKVPKLHRKYVELLRDNLEEITSPFVKQLSRQCCSLTPTEIRVCDMIRSGMQTKEIARIRGVSPATISRHREHIRRKLNIANDAINLTTFLQSNME